MALRPARTLQAATVDNTFPEQDGSSEVDPTIREDNGVLHLAYRLPYRLHKWRASAIVAFDPVVEWDYGGPNDHSLARHKNLWGLSLRPYEFHTVSPPPAPGQEEWIVTFHDACFRIVAARATVVSEYVQSDSPSDALNKHLGDGENTVL